jgi:triosephosphate isomerase
MSRRRLVAANWKMHVLAEDALRFAHRLPEIRDAHPGVDLAVFPSFTVLMVLARALSGVRVALGAQDCHWEAQGAFTGEVSPEMVADAGGTMVLVGHSERRALHGEDDEVVARKLRGALRAGVTPLLCVGETESERTSGRTESVLARQVRVALAGLQAADLARVAIAYEPVWAIGTGRTATPAMAAEAHAFVRGRVAALSSRELAADLRILYGGSIRPDSAAGLMAEREVDGGLVGGASLDAGSFAAIVAAAASRA